MIPHFLGTIIDTYHEKYHDQLKERQEAILKGKENVNMKILMCAELIPKNPKFEFIPSLFGLHIPLDSAIVLDTCLLFL